MSHVIFQAHHSIDEACSSIPCSSNITEIKLSSDQQFSSDSSSDSSGATSVVQDNSSKSYHEITKEIYQQSHVNGFCEVSQKGKHDSMVLQRDQNDNHIRGQSISELGKGESYKIQNCSSQCDKTTIKTTSQINKDIEIFKMKCYQSLKNSKINGKRKQNDAQLKFQEDEILDSEKEENENQDSSNKLQVEDSSCPRKILKASEQQKYSAPIKDTSHQITQQRSLIQENGQFLMQLKDLNENLSKNLPRSVSSLEQEDSLSSSSNLDSQIDEERNQQQQENLEKQQNENAQSKLKLIHKINDSLKQRIQRMEMIKNEVEKKFEQILQKRNCHIYNSHSTQDDQQDWQEIIKLQKLIEKTKQDDQIQTRQLQEEDVKLITQYNKSQNFMQQNNSKQAEYQIQSDNESMECREEESISDLIQQARSNSDQNQALQEEQIISEGEDSDHEEEVSDDSEVYISDTDEDMHLVKFNSSLYEKDYILILDLDNTLVHSFMGGPSLLGKGDPTVNNIETNVNDQKLYIKRRPYLKEFFEVAFKNFKVVMYTLGSLGYARAVYQLFKKEYPEIFNQYKFLRIIAQNTQRNSCSSPQALAQSISPQITAQKQPNQDSQPIQQQQQQHPSQNIQSSHQVRNQNTQSTKSSNPSSIQHMYMNKFLKNISKYFPPEKFSKRLLIFDDNSRVYEQFWWKNAIFTKPYHYWLNNNNSISTSSDSFLFFAAQILKTILVQAQADNPDLPSIYQNIRKNLLNNDRFYIPNNNPERQNLEELIKELGGELIQGLIQQNKKPSPQLNVQEMNQNHQQESDKNTSLTNKELLPNYIILNEQQQNNPVIQQIAFSHGIKIISSDWIKYCFLLNYKVSSDLFNFQNYYQYQQSINYQNLETDLVNHYIQFQISPS